MKNQFRIQIKETGEAMQYFNSLKKAQLKLDYWDIGLTPDFYEIAELTLDGTYKRVKP
jgi:hypothetical protein